MTIPDADLDSTRAALAPTLEATASILPWLAKPREPRFPPELAARWADACRRLGEAWNGRHGGGFKDIRPAVFALCAAALDLKDGDCLGLSEALASATDHLESPDSLGNARLVAALSATVDSLGEPEGVEHPAFPERARHFARRLHDAATARPGPLARSAALDRLFVTEARECLEKMSEALAALPPDAYGLKSAAAHLAHQAEMLELPAIAATGGELVRLLTLRAGESVDLENPVTRSTAETLLAALEETVAALA